MNYILVVTVLLLDQISKLLALKYLQPVNSIPVINNILNFTYVENRGAAFGILQNQKIFFILITLVVLALIWFYTHYNRLSRSVVFGLSLIAGGAIGNLIDRIRLGYVVDFFHVLNFPVFNIADSAVVIGTILVAIFIFRHN